MSSFFARDVYEHPAPKHKRPSMTSDDHDLEWSQVEERVVFRNDFVGIRNDLARRPDGVTVEYVVVENRSYSSVLCFDEDDRVILIQQFRYPWMKSSWEAPSGLIDGAETPEECARREVLEETGYEVQSLKQILKYHPTGLGPGVCHLFHAKVKKLGKQALDPNEFLRIGVFTSDEVELMIEKNKIVHASTLLGWAYRRK